ncbi:low molecular weight phosphotyrosine protein phosphatase [Myroides odoratimimus]|uniref:low molecular weight protein-tyrosine-phosphatase n=1 Tax=Myroides TaxID=76831 RepID=UPI00073E7F61|nr:MULTISPECIES: low molecular weight protein-tyrosine-phosphatase [Myroides]APA90665.1 protein-tyrosine-phosphatase [Myroides sp. ZB35]MDM1084979.1 low molecular weight phosphotyrosine protein phosphatase [Myroides odoratimimus]MDM1096435.1 low molecular weight phosphotyrosine protein phosphatase [Myroides odoratimimus]MDM1326471.1 low molecular weight phosphotyrosine protein phosphatase [Myroides odoratimimus]MDM1414331.1 low molecular weight phosphotyrosine protein phosphatase [Myroides odo
MTKVLMVCLGNICRSPLAKGILQSKLSTESFFVDSAGTGDWHIGSQPDKRSIAVAKKYNIDLTTQRARQFKVSDFTNFDRIYVMDKSNYENVIKLAPNQEAKNKVKLILNENTPGQNLEVPDPYFGGDDGFEHVFHLLDEVCNVIAKDLKS